MRKLVLCLFGSAWFIALGQSRETQPNHNREAIPGTSIVQADSALKFINLYVEYCNKRGDKAGVIEWVKSSPLVTQSFKGELTRIITEAKMREPELGLGFDPIFDAQDYPEKGFDLEAIDRTGEYLTVRGKDWSQFKLRMKMKNVAGEWLVEGCGMINIPTDERIER